MYVHGIQRAEVAATIIDHGDVGSSDGMTTDSANRVYTTNPEHNAILRHPLNGDAQLVTQDPQLLWPDTMVISTDNYLYVTTNQLNRQPKYHNGVDLRQKPYNLFRIKLDAGPIVYGAEMPTRELFIGGGKGLAALGYYAPRLMDAMMANRSFRTACRTGRLYRTHYRIEHLHAGSYASNARKLCSSR